MPGNPIVLLHFIFRTENMAMGNSEKSSRESELYKNLGASSSKDGIVKAVGASDKHSYFAQVSDDVCGDKDYYSVLHADGAGTKSIAAYLAYKESAEPAWFRGIAQDSLAMNLDDIACVGAFEGLLLSNTIGRNASKVPDECIAQLIEGYNECLQILSDNGIQISSAGGETADLGDIVRTIVVDSTLFGRVKKDKAINATRIQTDDVIVGISGIGKTTYESKENSGIGSNGYTLARHALLPSSYLDRYPEIVEPELEHSNRYQGKNKLFDEIPELKGNLAESLLSPTRMYAPILLRILEELDQEIHFVVHCTGGGQTKLLRFGAGKQFIKDDLFDCPPIFRLIQSQVNVPWAEMYAVFNMGHRLEIVCPERHLNTIKEITKSFGIEAKRVGFVSGEGSTSTLQIKSEFGEFNYTE